MGLVALFLDQISCLKMRSNIADCFRALVPRQNDMQNVPSSSSFLTDMDDTLVLTSVVDVGASSKAADLACESWNQVWLYFSPL